MFVASLHWVHATTPPSGGGPGSTLDFDVIRLSTLSMTLGDWRRDEASLSAPSSSGCVMQLPLAGASARELILEQTGATASCPAAHPSHSRCLLLSWLGPVNGLPRWSSLFSSCTVSLSVEAACFSRSSGSLLDEPAICVGRNGFPEKRQYGGQHHNSRFACLLSDLLSLALAHGLSTVPSSRASSLRIAKPN